MNANLEKAEYMFIGAVADKLDLNRRFHHPFHVEPVRPKTRILFTFWYAPEYKIAKSLLEDLGDRFLGNGLEIGVGLFTRPMGDVQGEDFDYDSGGLEEFCEAAIRTSMPVAFYTSGYQWTEVAYKKSPLLAKLEERDENLLKFKDGTRVPRKLQPPAQYIPGFLRGPLGLDQNGVLYLNPNSSEFMDYRYRNLSQYASRVAQFFAKDYPDLYLGISTENEIDYPGFWITKGREVDVGEHNEKTDYAFKYNKVVSILQREVDIFKEAGLTNIYTNQSVEDAKNRASPLATADIPGANIGITAWRRGNRELFVRANTLAKQRNKKWALQVTNPSSLDYVDCDKEFLCMLQNDPAFIGFYNWWPHFPRYGIKGLALERVIRDHTW